MRSWKGNTGFKNEEWKVLEGLRNVFPHKDIHNNSILLLVIIPRFLSNILQGYKMSFYCPEKETNESKFVFIIGKKKIFFLRGYEGSWKYEKLCKFAN